MARTTDFARRRTLFVAALIGALAVLYLRTLLVFVETRRQIHISFDANANNANADVDMDVAWGLPAHFAALRAPPPSLVAAPLCVIVLVDLSFFDEFLTKEYASIFHEILRHPHTYLLQYNNTMTSNSVAVDVSQRCNSGRNDSGSGGGHASVAAADVVVAVEVPNVCSLLNVVQERNSQMRIVQWTNDVQRWGVEAHNAYASMLACSDVILSPYAYYFEDYYAELFSPEAAKHPKIIWLPNSAQPFYTERGRWDTTRQTTPPAERNKILLAGAISENYPCRQSAQRVCQSARGAALCYIQAHPGYARAGGRNRTAGGKARDDAFAASIARHRFALTDGTLIDYLISKHFEVMATGTALITTHLERHALTQLGYVRNVHFVTYENCSLEAVGTAFETYAAVAASDEAFAPFAAMARAAAEFTAKHHTTQRRGQYLYAIAIHEALKSRGITGRHATPLSSTAGTLDVPLQWPLFDYEKVRAQLHADGHSVRNADGSLKMGN